MPNARGGKNRGFEQTKNEENKHTSWRLNKNPGRPGQATGLPGRAADRPGRAGLAKTGLGPIIGNRPVLLLCIRLFLYPVYKENPDYHHNRRRLLEPIIIRLLLTYWFSERASKPGAEGIRHKIRYCPLEKLFCFGWKVFFSKHWQRDKYYMLIMQRM